MRWLKAYWDEDDLELFFEVDADLVVLRQVELRGPSRVPTVAAALAELPDANREGIDAVCRYEARYGVLSDQPLGELDVDFPHVEVSRAEFERVWARARAHLDALASSRG